MEDLVPSGPGPRSHADTYVIPLDRCSPDVAERVGGKARGLGRLCELGVPVPHGFAIDVAAYHRFVSHHGLTDRIAEEVESAAGDHRDTRAAASRIAALLADRALPDDVADAVFDAYEALEVSRGEHEGQARVAVRSSATVEDTADASFAGQQETYLWIRGRDDVARHVALCWGSLFTPQAIAYRARLGIGLDDLGMGVVVQRMVPARCAGVMMTLEPVTGDRATIYVESTYGAGNGVVRGDVGTDRHWIDKSSGRPRHAEISTKATAHRFDDGSAAGAVVDVEPEDQDRPALTDEELQALARLGLDIEDGFGAPMDVEWAIDEDGAIHVLQARPETVWSRGVGDGSAAGDTADEPGGASGGRARPDPVHTDLPRDDRTLWSPGNVGEAVPGVSTALNWTFAGDAIESATRRSFASIGALAQREIALPSAERDRFINVFFGRTAANIDALRMIGDRLPGASGDGLERQIFGVVREGVASEPTRRRWPFVLARLPRTVATITRDSGATRARTVAWWQQQVLEPPSTADAARHLLCDARDRYIDGFQQGATVALLLSGVYDQLRAVLTDADLPSLEQRLLTGLGGMVEGELVADVWALGRGELDLGYALLRHGYHGPDEGQIQSRSWREDPAPLLRLADRYRALDDSRAPAASGRRQAAERQAAEKQLIERLGPAARARAKGVLALVRALLPLREIGKANYTQCLDAARLAARHLGRHYADAGTLDEPDDIFHLTYTELVSDRPPAEPRSLVDLRRRRHDFLRGLAELPERWVGPAAEVGAGTTPSDAPQRADAAGSTSGRDVITGLAVAGGVVTGRARIVLDPIEGDLEPGEILVCHNTDPSYAPLFHLAAGLVTDFGGALSHGAIVARELGIPCVSATGNATTTLTTGDLITLHGDHGRIEVQDSDVIDQEETR